MKGSRAGSRGVSVVESAIVFAIGGSLLAVAVPTFARELQASRFVEPASGLEKMSSAAIAYAHDRAAREAFPPTAPLTPTEPPRGVRAIDPLGAWDTPTWRALDFRPVPEGVPHFFAFGFDSSVEGVAPADARSPRNPGPVRGSFVAHAHGDLDGDGVRSTFEVRGHAVDGDPAGPTLEPGMYVDAEVE